MDLLHRRSAQPPPRPVPSVVLWRWRHLVVGLCVGAAALVALTVLRPGPGDLTEALVVTRQVGAGEVIQETDVAWSRLPTTALPRAGLADGGVVGTRAAVTLEEGTVLTTSMTSQALTTGLTAQERVVQVPVEVGADLARPGTVVDLVAEAPQAGDVTGTGTAAEGPTVICKGARVLLTQHEGSGDRWSAGSTVTLITLAVPASTASLVAGAATHGALGLVLSP
ncbi:SAF domain-containing protein [Actinomyces faecalis]|uniref:SAF domain-containing protein n=1 Tax=Actinomyces faecalis TaxID=2722820 RepID=UPI0015522174|nr:SAF domain-containing protein [Actinomyces faecalis]